MPSHLARILALAVAILAPPLQVASQELSIPVDLVAPLGCILSSGCWGERANTSYESMETGEIILTPDKLLQTLRDADAASLNALGAPELAETYLDLAEYVRWNYAGIDTNATAEQLDEIKAYPNVIGPWPPEILKVQNSFLASGGMLRCEAAFEALQKIEESVEIVIKAKSEIADKDELERGLSLALYALYVRDCFSTFKDFDEEYFRRLILLVRITEDKLIRPYCAGFNIEGSLFVTARHCLVDERSVGYFVDRYGEKDRSNYIEIERILPKTAAIFANNPSIKYEIKLLESKKYAAQNRFNPNIPEDDVIVVELLGHGKNIDRFPIDTPSQWMKIFIPTVHLLSLDSSKNNSTQSYVRLDDSPICRIFYADKRGCLFHSCQTRSGFSGSPLLARKGNEVVLVGIHTGSIGLDNPPCEFRRKHFFPNYGVSLPASLLQE